MGFKNNRIKIGGFCGINSGKISHSYAVSKIGEFKNKCGFCFQNSGKINSCFANALANKLYLDLFCRFNFGNTTLCFSNTNNVPKTDSQENSADETNTLYDFKNTTLADLCSNHDFVLNDFWEDAEDSTTLLSLELRKDIYDVSSLADERGAEKISVTTKEQLFEIASKIKNGDKNAASAYYVLENDIDLKGKSWTPIGNMIAPFMGLFDGCGHKIYNFKVTNQDLMFAGFFGVVENAIIANLSVDGIVKAGRYTGGFVGMSRNSGIYACSANCQVIGTENVGGFVGNNAGVIEGCYYNGTIKRPFPIAWIALVPIIAILILILLYILNPKKNTATFNNVPVDPYSVRTRDNSLYTGSENKASFRFSDVVKYNNGEATVDFGSPDTTNQSMTIKIQITDAELTKKIGKTGRTSDEQKEFDQNPNYDPSNTRITISESGLILPGYNLQKLILKELPDGTQLPNGVYNGIAFLNFFNHATNEKAIINSQVPVAVVVE